jgi:flagellar motility protein MotE (MotC chaperone)
MKKILLWVGLGFLLFIILVGITFGVLMVLNPVDADIQMDTVTGDQKLAREMLAQKQQEIDQLHAELDSLLIDLEKNNLARDSLAEENDFNAGLIREYRKTIEMLNAELSVETKKNLSVKELAKTYESMKINEMQPIVEKLDDHTIMDIYTNISSRNRKNLLMALSAKRAAIITQRIAENGIE